MELSLQHHSLVLGEIVITENYTNQKVQRQNGVLQGLFAADTSS